jgi:acetoin utilization deacetylase AcuC-like enzyme
MLLLSLLPPAVGSYAAARRHTRHKLASKARTAASHRLVYSVSHAEQHDKPGHPEAAARITAIEQALSHQHFSNQLDVVSGISMDAQAVMRSLELVHPAGYLQRLQEICTSVQVRHAAILNAIAPAAMSCMRQQHSAATAEAQSDHSTGLRRSQPWWTKAPTYAQAPLQPVAR